MACSNQAQIIFDIFLQANPASVSSRLHGFQNNLNTILDMLSRSFHSFFLNKHFQWNTLCKIWYQKSTMYLVYNLVVRGHTTVIKEVRRYPTHVYHHFSSCLVWYYTGFISMPSPRRCWQFLINSRWRHLMETFYRLLALCKGNLPVDVDVSFDLCLNKRFSKPSRRPWFEMPSNSLWCHCDIAFLPGVPLINKSQ